MQIFAKRAFKFGPGLKKDGSIESFVTKPNLFMDMPDKFANDELFKDAVKLGYVTIVGEKEKTEVEAEDFANTAGAKLEEIKATIIAMNHDELVEKASELNIKLTGNEKDKIIRKMIFEASK